MPIVVYKFDGFGSSSLDKVVSWEIVVVVKPNYFSFDVIRKIVGGSSGDWNKFGRVVSIKWSG